MGSPLDDVCLPREMALAHLLGSGKTVLRTDSDTFFHSNPFTLRRRLGADFLVSAQPLKATAFGGMWAYDWRCNKRVGKPMELTLNNGVMLIDGRNPAVVNTYGRAVGLGLKLLSRARNGWAQLGFNAVLHEHGLCLRDWDGIGAASGSQERLGMLWGALPGSKISTFSVCAPCGGCRNVSSSHVLVHANCLGTGFSLKIKYLQDVGCWKLPLEWEHVKRVGDAAAFLDSLIELT